MIGSLFSFPKPASGPAASFPRWRAKRALGALAAVFTLGLFSACGTTGESSGGAGPGTETVESFGYYRIAVEPSTRETLVGPDRNDNDVRNEIESRIESVPSPRLKAALFDMAQSGTRFMFDPQNLGWTKRHLQKRKVAFDCATNFARLGEATDPSMVESLRGDLYDSEAREKARKLALQAVRTRAEKPAEGLPEGEVASCARWYAESS